MEDTDLKLTSHCSDLVLTSIMWEIEVGGRGIKLKTDLLCKEMIHMEAAEAYSKNMLSYFFTCALGLISNRSFSQYLNR